jgi:hypothetical protein
MEGGSRASELTDYTVYCPRALSNVMVTVAWTIWFVQGQARGCDVT